VNKRIGFVVVSTLFLFVVLSIPLAFSQAGYATVELNVQCTDYYFWAGNLFDFEVIAPQAGTPNTIIASDDAHTYTINLVPGDLVVVRVEGLTSEVMTYTEASGHLMYSGPADSITVNEVEIPEFSSFLIVPLFVIASLLAVIVLRRKLTS
jgi:hypothetical protein